MQDTVVLPQGKKGQDGDFEDLLTSGSISTLLDVQGFSDLEKSLSPTPVMGSPSRDPFNTSVPEEFHTSILEVSIPSSLPASKGLEASEKAKLPPQPETSFEESDGKIILGAAVETPLHTWPSLAFVLTRHFHGRLGFFFPEKHRTNARWWHVPERQQGGMRLVLLGVERIQLPTLAWYLEARQAV